MHLQNVHVMFIILIQLTLCGVIKLIAPWGEKTALAYVLWRFFHFRNLKV